MTKQELVEPVKLMLERINDDNCIGVLIEARQLIASKMSNELKLDEFFQALRDISTSYERLAIKKRTKEILESFVNYIENCLYPVYVGSK